MRCQIFRHGFILVRKARFECFNRNITILNYWFFKYNFSHNKGQIAPQRAILQVRKYKSQYKEGVEAFLEEAIVRRELSDNFCFFNKNYDSLKGCADWAQNTLNDHRKDKREWVYSVQELEESKTHDDLWNSAQIQLRKEGKLHGFLRMYWAKKILEWSESPEAALKAAIYLNDYYAIDGRDPNGYVGLYFFFNC